VVAVTGPEVLFTGFPGFLGSALVERLLSRGDGPIACLVQPQYLDTAQQRAQAILDATDESVPADAIRLYEGDITDSGLGLSDAVSDLDTVQEVYHLAALYDLGVDPGPAEAVNVKGTTHVLDVAERLAVEHVHYVSTCYVSGRYDGVFTESHLQEGQSFNNHYERSKYRAEVAVQQRMDDGLPVTIYRPAIVVGDSRTGETDKYDGPYYLLELLRAQPRWLSASFTLANSATAELNVVPRDFVVDAITFLSARPPSHGAVYQLCDPAPLTVPRFLDALAEAAGHRTVTVPTTRRVAQAALSRLESAGWAVEPAAVDYLDHPTRYACPATRRALADSDIEVPPFESYVDRLVEFVCQHPTLGDDPMV